MGRHSEPDNPLATQADLDQYRFRLGISYGRAWEDFTRYGYNMSEVDAPKENN